MARIPPSVRPDLTVAAAAAGAALALTAVLALLGRDPGVAVQASPLVVYLAYAFTRKGGPYTAYDTPRNWALLAGLVAVAAVILVVGL